MTVTFNDHLADSPSFSGSLRLLTFLMSGLETASSLTASVALESLPLDAPDDGPGFSFPYATPYSIQLDLMRVVFSTLERSQIAIVQSPTGTVRPREAWPSPTR